MATSSRDTGSLRSMLAVRIRANREEIVHRWLERINARVAIEKTEVFPTDELINHVPLLLDGVADFLEAPEQDLDTSGPVTAKAMELGALRHAQGFDAYEILKEHELLCRILFTNVRPLVDELGDDVTPIEVIECWEQISQAIELIRQATVTQFLRLAADRVNERESRLRSFNRMVAHELKNRVGAVRGAAHMLEETWLTPEERSRFQRMIIENTEGLQSVLTNLESLSRLESDARQRKNILLPQAAAEVVRQLREAAQAKRIDVQIADDLPPVEVDAAAVELCLTNLVSNAIKYSDTSRSNPWVKISGELVYPNHLYGELIVRVSDNGMGVPVKARDRLFEQFYRAHSETVTEAEGTGLGLSIVRETAESLGGRAWAEFPESGGTTFAFCFPSRREEDAAAAGTRRDSVSQDSQPTA